MNDAEKHQREERHAERMLIEARRLRLRSKRVPVEEWPQQRPRPVAPPEPKPVTLADMVQAETAIAADAEPTGDIATVEVEGDRNDSL